MREKERERGTKKRGDRKTKLERNDKENDRDGASQRERERK